MSITVTMDEGPGALGVGVGVWLSDSGQMVVVSLSITVTMDEGPWLPEPLEPPLATARACAWPGRAWAAARAAKETAAAAVKRMMNLVGAKND